MSKRNSNSFWIIIVIIVTFLLFVASLGNASGDKIKQSPNAFKDSKEEAKRKHKRLVQLIAKQIALKEKLNRKFKRIYVGVRIGLVMLWAGLMTSLIVLRLVQNLGDFLNYTQVLVLVFLTFNYVTFGSLKNFKDYVALLKTKTENWVYGKYVNIDNRIEATENAKLEIEKVIDENK